MSSTSSVGRVRIHAIQTGTVAVKQSQRDGGGRNLARVLLTDSKWTEPLPILCWLIEHPEGLILVDTGETPRVSEPGYLTAWQPYFRYGMREWVTPQDAVGAQIERLGFPREDVREVVLTHFHTDHAGGIEDLAESRFNASRKDYVRARGLLGKARGFLPQHWPAGFSPRLADFRDGPFGPFAASTTLTRAGDVHLLPTPGHTPGHLSVAVEDGDTVFFLAGDASYTERMMLDGAVDGLTADPASSRDTTRRIRTLAADRPTVYLPTHDPAAAQRLADRQPTMPPAGASAMSRFDARPHLAS